MLKWNVVGSDSKPIDKPTNFADIGLSPVVSVSKQKNSVFFIFSIILKVHVQLKLRL